MKVYAQAFEGDRQISVAIYLLHLGRKSFPETLTFEENPIDHLKIESPIFGTCTLLRVNGVLIDESLRHPDESATGKVEGDTRTSDSAHNPKMQTDIALIL